ncbi:GGDEF domain-containing protein [Rubrivivax gelatinosus]|nr:GGDEF domain-containing protein [Rubrivivax gelatinosus]
MNPDGDPQALRARLAEVTRLGQAGDLARAREQARAAFRDAITADEAELAVEAGLACYTLDLKLGDHVGMLEDGARLKPRLQALPARRREYGDLLRRIVISACELARFDVALAHASEACESARLHPDDRELALSLTALGACFERMGDAWQGERLMNEANAAAQRLDEPYVRMVVLNNLCAVCIGRFHRLREVDEADARASIERAIVHALAAQAMLPLMPDPLFAVFVDGNLGEALLYAGRLDEAAAMLHDALARSRKGGYHAQTWRIACSIAELELARGQPEQALAELEALLDTVAAAEQRATLIRLHHAIYRAARALGQNERALAALEAYERLERERATGQLRAQSELFVTRAETERVRQEALAARERAQRFRDEARRDALTGLSNRRELQELLPAQLLVAAAQRRPVSLAVVDLDHFKRINDRHGHALGDRVLVAIAQLLRDGLRQADVLARVGGEEFVVVLFDTSPELAHDVLERLRHRVAEHDWSGLAPEMVVSLSIGLAHAPGYDLEPLFERADRALYRAKAEGRNRLVVDSQG